MPILMIFSPRPKFFAGQRLRLINKQGHQADIVCILPIHPAFCCPRYINQPLLRENHA